MCANVKLLDVSEVNVEIGIIGGSGLYHLNHLKVLGELRPETPWGFPSDALIICETELGHRIAFLSRHGRGHYLNPSEVPNKANIAAFKKIGCKILISFSAVGSLREELAPRDFVMPSQAIDRTKGLRDSSFFVDGVVGHVPFADPFTPEIQDIIADCFPKMNEKVNFHKNKTLICMEGPAFSTKAESHLYRSWGADLINMSAIPECKLAREAQICYGLVCMVTDYDCWKVEEEPVSIDTVIANLSANSSAAASLLEILIPRLESSISSLDCVKEMEGPSKCIMTAPHKRNPETVEKLRYMLDLD